MRNLLLVALCVAVPACSFTGVTRRPSKAPGTRPVACTESLGRPRADLAIGLLSVGLSALAFSAASSGTGTSDDAEVNAIFGVTTAAISVPFLISSLYGYGETRSCRDLNASAPPRA